MIKLAPAGADLFASQSQAIVNPVNCVGAMGKGLALAFKQRYPGNFGLYAAACAQAKANPAALLGTLIAPSQEPDQKWVLNLPTKLHWRDKSQLDWVRSGALALDAFCQARQIRTCALPALGCGEGGLDWEQQVWPLLQEVLGTSPTRYFALAPQLTPSPARAPSAARLK